MPNYQNGKLYKVVNSENDVIYIGSTTQRLAIRMCNHRGAAKKLATPFYIAMREIGIEKFSIELIKLYPCDSQDELEAAEGRYMKKFLKKELVLYNSTIDGKLSEADKEKKRKAQTGKVLSEITKEKLSKSQTGKTGSLCSRFKRGSVSFCKSTSRWVFKWQENKKQKSKSFAISVHGESGAKKKAIAVQDSIYPQ